MSTASKSKIIAVDGQHSVVAKTIKFPLVWKHIPVDPNILRPQNEFQRQPGQFYEKTLMDRVNELKKQTAYKTIVANLRKAGKFDTALRPQFKWVPISQIFIDEDIQRELDIDHALTILKNFDPRRISPIYAVKDIGVDKFHSTDGQHNSVIQVLLAHELLWDGVNSEDELLIPVWYIETNDRSFARDLFTFVNGVGRKQVDDHVKLRTRVFKYRIDGKRDKDSELAHDLVKACEDGNCTPVRKKDKQNSGLAGAITHTSGILERQPKTMKFIAKQHDTYWNDSKFDSCEFGFYESFYKEFILDKTKGISVTDKSFKKFMDDINMVVKTIFWTHNNLKNQAEAAWSDWYRKCHGKNVDVPSPADNMAAGIVCRIYQKLGGNHPVLDEVHYLTHQYDITDFLGDVIVERVEKYL